MFAAAGCISASCVGDLVKVDMNKEKYHQIFTHHAIFRYGKQLIGTGFLFQHDN